jgi:hypothetical protein
VIEHHKQERVGALGCLGHLEGTVLNQPGVEVPPGIHVFRQQHEQLPRQTRALFLVHQVQEGSLGELHIPLRLDPALRIAYGLKGAVYILSSEPPTSKSLV